MFRTSDVVALVCQKSGYQIPGFHVVVGYEDAAVCLHGGLYPNVMGCFSGNNTPVIVKVNKMTVIRSNLIK